jgi:hypothetical protein
VRQSRDQSEGREAVEVEAKGWNNGTPRATGAGYGIRISRADRNAHFEHAWRSVTFSLDGQSEVEVSLTPSFWRQCTELRGAEIGRWMIARGLAPWPAGQPPTFELTRVGDARFVLRPTAGTGRQRK